MSNIVTTDLATFPKSPFDLFQNVGEVINGKANIISCNSPMGNRVIPSVNLICIHLSAIHTNHESLKALFENLLLFLNKRFRVNSHECPQVRKEMR